MGGKSRQILVPLVHSAALAPQAKIGFSPCIFGAADANIDSTNSVQFLINLCHEECVRDRNQAGIEAADFPNIMPIPRFPAHSVTLLVHTPCDMSSSENGHC
eukprot:gene17327-biopygen4944